MPKQKIQGEGDYEATRRFRKRTEEYLNNNDVEKAAVRAAPTSAKEAEDMKAAEAAGKRRAKGEDPAIRRRAAPRVEPSTRGKTSRH
ncbi:MAG TPA: hypothetical protein VFU13_10445 [Steroidobacteraceae bacterium]|nr:hypothetical protein [Steroidobacteraceae bacterium]